MKLEEQRHFHFCTEQLIGEARIFTNKRKREAKKESVQEELRNTSIQYTIHK